MKKFPKKYIFLLFIITALILSVMAVSYKTGSTAANSALGMVLAPVQKATAFAVNGTKKVVKNVALSSKNAKKNEKLKAEVSLLRDELRMLEGYKTENERLKKLLELKDSLPELKTTAASVIGKDIGELHCTITLNKGTDDKIVKDAVVLTTDGLVGVVCEAGKNYSKVKTIFDAESSVSVMCARSGDMGILEGNPRAASEGICTMSYIDKEAKIVQGDSLETSGTGGIYPRGIFVGKAVEIKSDERNLTLNAAVEAGVNIRSLDTVLVEVK